MNVRILPREEWGRLEHTGMPVLPGPQSGDVDVVVVEDGERVVACLTVLRVTHFEGAWVDPERKGLGATRAMLRLAVELMRVRGEGWVMAGADNSDTRMAKILARMGAIKLPVTPYVLAIGRA